MSANHKEGTTMEVSLVSIGAEASKTLAPYGGNKNRPEYVFIFNSYPMNAGASPIQLLGYAPKRCRTVITINNTGATPALVAFGKSQSDVEQAIQSGGTEIIGAVTYVSAPVPYMEVCGNTELWAALITAGTSQCIVGTIKEMDNC